jgi:hypothetical protein
VKFRVGNKIKIIKPDFESKLKFQDHIGIINEIWGKSISILITDDKL